MTENQEQSYGFKTEVAQLLHILTHSLYKEKDIFLREAISNASDALTRMHFESLTNHDVLDANAELAIHVVLPAEPEAVGEDDDEETKAAKEAAIAAAAEKPKTIIIKDSGLGMSKEELITNLGTIAQSGARSFIDEVSENEDVDLGDVIGQFGVGFYSLFMVASEVRVLSRSHKKDEKAAVWISTGDASFRVEDAEKEDRGTEVHLTLRKDSEEFANEWKLKQVLKKHSDFVRYPVYLGEEQINQQESLWRKRPSDVEDEQYKNFYREMTMDFEEPLRTIHFSADAPVNVRAMLFVPAKLEKGVLAKRKEQGLMLYSHNILIEEYNTDLLPHWLSFVDGVVDSEEITLNVSRETVQSNRVIRHLAKTLKSRVIRELKKMGKKDLELYEQFWNEYSRALKEGIATDYESKDDILPMLRYVAAHSDGKLISLDEYVETMPEDQDEIYYVMGSDLKSIANSAHLDPFKERDLNVLYWTDPLDVLIAPSLGEFKGKKFRNVDDSSLELPEIAKKEGDDDKNDSVDIPEANFESFVEQCTTLLGDKVTEVRASKVLKNSPVRLVSPEGENDQEMLRIARLMGQEYEVPKKVMEVNNHHPFIADLAEMAATDADNRVLALSVEQLYESALVQEGLHPNPADMLPRIQELMELAAK